MIKYDPSKIEPKWQEKWEKSGIYSPDLARAQKPFYNLMMFPYPSAEGLHVGNMYAFTGSDIYGQFKRMQGFDVFEPIGLDGFGIHSENYALEVGRHPTKQAKISEKNFYRQLRATGNAYDWTRKLQTYDPNYYKWTQWIFIQLFKKGLAYRKKAPVNFCPQDKTVLADEQVVNGRCERCGTVVEKRELEQWFFKITAYADRLLENLEKLDWSERVKIAQKQWIGRSEGASIKFAVEGAKLAGDNYIKVFTTRPDTLFGATFMVVAPEHPLALSLKEEKIGDYIKAAKRKTESERIAKGREKTGVFTGFYAVNPVNGQKIPIWVADYVLSTYGTGAIMAVPGHDERDWQFAKKYKLPIVEVIREEGSNVEAGAYTGGGVIVNSSFWNGLRVPDEIDKVIDWLLREGKGEKEKNYHLRDWLISRQRYWGSPIPMIHCEKCSWQAVPEKDLPVLLPDVADWRPKGTGESPLANVASFVNTKCPNCKGPAKRETDVSDTFLDSAWYFLRYLATDIADRAWDKKRSQRWLPVDMYIGGAEHSVLHLLYTRFLSMVLDDLGLVNFSAKGGLADEPFAKFRAHGLLISGGAKMSKSRGNVVVPDAYIDKYGADTLRCYLMFCGQFTQGGDFKDTGISGMHKFLKRVWRLAVEAGPVSGLTDEAAYLMHKTIKKVTEDIEDLSYNTAISALMIWLNSLEERVAGPVAGSSRSTSSADSGSNRDRNPSVSLRALSGTPSARATRKRLITREEIETFLKLLAPFAPHMTEELWQQLKVSKAKKTFKSIHSQLWSRYDPKLAQAKTITLVVQVNGKVRDKLLVEAGISQEEAEKLAVGREKVQKYLGKKKPRKIIFVSDRLINFVIS